MENLPTIAQQNRPMAIIPADFESAYRMARIMAASGLMPKGIQSAEAVFVAMQLGAEIGLSPMASVQNVAVINGKPGIYGDAALAVVRASGQLEIFEEWSEGDRKTPGWTFFCKIKRKGFKEVIGKYTWAQAIDAGLDKPHPDSPWRKWTDRMMQFKARNFPLRDLFSDYLKGIRTTEENVDAIDADFIDHNPSANRQVVSLKDKLNEKLSAIAIAAPVPPAQDAPDELLAHESSETSEPKQEETKPVDEWDAFRSKFINLKVSGFAAFVFDHQDQLRSAPVNIKKEALDKWNKLYPTQPFPLIKTVPNQQDTVEPDEQPGELPERQSSVEHPVSFSREYKHLMDLKRDFPEFYIEAAKELSVGPDTIINCVNISALIGRKVDEQAESEHPAEAYVPPAENDTSGF